MMSSSKKIQEGDIKVPSPPTDGISSLSLNGDLQNRSNILVATSWDNSVSLEPAACRVVGVPAAAVRAIRNALFLDMPFVLAFLAG